MTYTISIRTQNGFNRYYDPQANEFDGVGGVMPRHILDSEQLENHKDSAINKLISDGCARDKKDAKNMLMLRETTKGFSMEISTYHKSYKNYRAAEKKGALHIHHTDFNSGFLLRELKKAVRAGLRASGMEHEYNIVVIGRDKAGRVEEFDSRTIR